MQQLTTNNDAIFYRRNSVHDYIEVVDGISGEVLAVQNDYNEDFILGKRDALVEVTVGDKTILMQKGMSISTQYVPSTSKYSRPLVDLIIQEMMENNTGVTVACKKFGVSYSTLMRWTEKYPEVGEALDKAKRLRADTTHDKIVGLADDLINKQLNKTQVEAIGKAADLLKWSAEKSDPNRFGNAKDKATQGAVQIVINTGIQREPEPTTIDITPSQESP
jgi:transposase-like protein